MNKQELDILGTHAIAIDIATELLAEASNQTTKEDWLTLVMAKAFTKYRDCSPKELEEVIKRILKELPRS